MDVKMGCIEVVERRRVSAYFTILVLANEIEICLSFQPHQGLYVGTAFKSLGANADTGMMIII